jgi:hypothetical protein
MNETTETAEKVDSPLPYEVRQQEDDWSGVWLNVIVRTADGAEVGSDGWAALGCPEDATFTRDLRWVPEELNRLAVALSDLADWVEGTTGTLLPSQWHAARRALDGTE